MTRQELYDLVWKEPLTHAAKRFGISDVALRKTCVKHNIPTPPLGYWTKIAHGKKVSQPALPQAKQNEQEWIRLEPSVTPVLPEDVSASLTTVRQQAIANRVSIVVPKEKPETLHPIAKELASILRKSRQDDIGLVNWNAITRYYPTVYSISISRPLIERAVILLHALFTALATGGHDVVLDSGIRISIDDEPFDLTLRETKDKESHKPTAEELRRQQQHDADAKRYPTLYQPGKIVWRTWDYLPSGRLCLQLTDPTQMRWDDRNLVGRWYDRKTKPLESYLAEAIPALAEASILAKHRRAERLEQERIRAEREEMQRREQARHERQLKRRDYLKKKADAYEKYTRLEKLWKLLQPQVAEASDPASRIVGTLGKLLAVERQQFVTSTIEEEVREQGLFADDDSDDTT